MMRTIMCALTTLLLSVVSAPAQTIGIATTPPGSLSHSIASAMAKVVVEKAGIQMRVQPGASHAHLAVEKGEIELSVSTDYDVLYFIEGVHEYAGSGRKQNIRIAMRVLPLPGVMFVRKDSDIKTLADLRGRRLGSGFNSQKSVLPVLAGYYANAGFLESDVRGVPTQNVVTAANDFTSGKTDAFLFALGSAKVKEVSASVGGLRALPLDTSPAALERMKKALPVAYPHAVTPSPVTEGITEPMQVMGYDFIMFVNKNIADELMYRLVKTIHDNKPGLVSTFPGLGSFDPAQMAKSYEGLTYHPGGVKYYREIGIWPAK
jgi:TRAP transporter TAXI family solute receptor